MSTDPTIDAYLHDPVDDVVADLQRRLGEMEQVTQRIAHQNLQLVKRVLQLEQRVYLSQQTAPLPGSRPSRIILPGVNDQPDYQRPRGATEFDF